MKKTGKKCNINGMKVLQQIERGKGFCSDMKASDHVQPTDPNCMQSNTAGQLPKSGGLYCAELLPAADVRNALYV